MVGLGLRLGLGLGLGLRSTLGFTAGAIFAGTNVGHSNLFILNIIQNVSVESQKSIITIQEMFRTRRALSMYKVYSDSALLVLNIVNALLVLG